MSRKRLYTIEEAADRLGRSVSTIYSYLRARTLEQETVEGKRHVTEKSIKLFEKNQGRASGGKFSRRTFLTTVALFLAAPFYAKIVADWLADFYGKNAINVDIEDLFRYWDELNLYQGAAHPKHANGSHPDVAEAQSEISRFMEGRGNVEFRPWEECLRLSYDNNFLSVGGPISNDISRKIHGYRLIDQKISIEPMIKTDFRWHFHYPESSENDPKYFRFVQGQEVPTMAKGIYDRSPGLGGRKILYPGTYPESQRILKDYLLLTVVENQLGGKPTGKHIVDIADLNGQGNKLFPKIMADKERRKELSKEVKGKPYYQALYEVEVEHDEYNMITYLGDYKLCGVHLLS